MKDWYVKKGHSMLQCFRNEHKQATPYISNTLERRRNHGTRAYGSRTIMVPEGEVNDGLGGDYMHPKCNSRNLVFTLEAVRNQ